MRLQQRAGEGMGRETGGANRNRGGFQDARNHPCLGGRSERQRMSILRIESKRKLVIFLNSLNPM